MADLWAEKLDIYLDGELPAAEMSALDTHVRSCPECACTRPTAQPFTESSHLLTAITDTVTAASLSGALFSIQFSSTARVQQAHK